jgi:hypothetical protein
MARLPVDSALCAWFPGHGGCNVGATPSNVARLGQEEAMRLGSGLWLALLLIGVGVPVGARAELCFDPFDPGCRSPSVGPGREIYELRSPFTLVHDRALSARRRAPLGDTGFTTLDALLSGLRLSRIDVSGDRDRRDRSKRRGVRAHGGPSFVMLGVRAAFGETFETELWCELGGIAVLDHAVVVDGGFRPFDLSGLFGFR